MQRITATVRQKIWFTYNGSQAQFVIAARNHFEAAYRRRSNAEEQLLDLHAPRPSIPFDLFF